jgi:undecaprenyl-diphosphatase
MNTSLEWLNQIDRSILYFINNNLSNPIFDLFFTTITNEHLWAIPALIGLIALIVRGGKRGKIAVVLLLIAAIVTDKTVVEIIKPAIGRLRPSHALGDTVNLLVPKGGRYGFVSAHAANIFVGTTILSYFYDQWKKPLLFLAFSVALSRV